MEAIKRSIHTLVLGDNFQDVAQLVVEVETDADDSPIYVIIRNDLVPPQRLTVGEIMRTAEALRKKFTTSNFCADHGEIPDFGYRCQRCDDAEKAKGSPAHQVEDARHDPEL